VDTRASEEAGFGATDDLEKPREDGQVDLVGLRLLDGLSARRRSPRLVIIGLSEPTSFLR
jgi:hypothetical protein